LGLWKPNSKNGALLDGPVVFDANGKIISSGHIILQKNGEFNIGGSWMDEGSWSDGHPDFMWIPYAVAKPTEFANPHVDIEWIKKHILSGGVHDPTVTPIPVPNAPPLTPPRTEPPVEAQNWSTLTLEMWTDHRYGRCK